MKHIVQHIVLCLVFASFMIYTCGIHLYFEFRVASVKKQNNIAGLVHDSEHDLLKLEIPMDEITWVEDHEIYWQGELYDIAEKKIQDGVLICTAYHDEKEKELNDHYAAHTSSGSPENTNPNLQVKVIHPFMRAEDEVLAVFPDYITLHAFHLLFFLNDYSDRYFPPPKV